MESKKELKAQYRQRRETGGAFVIRNTVDGRILLDVASDLQGRRNRFAFAQSTGLCTEPKLQGDWDRLGSGIFAFEVLQELQRGETQTASQFREDLAVLKELWAERLAGSDRY